MSTQIVSTLGVLEGRPRSFGSVHQKYDQELLQPCLITLLQRE